MDPLSSSVSSCLKPTNFNSTPRQLHPLKPLNRPRHLPPPSPQRPLLFSTTKPTTISTSFTHKNLTALPIFPHPTSLLPSSSLHVHRTPATGYAAALLDTTQSTGSLHEVRRDVRKLSRLLQNSQIQALLNDPFLGDQEKGKAMKELAKKGKFNKHLFNLLKMMVEKNKLGIVSEVLEEFERVYDELIGTKQVWVSSEKMIGEDMLFKIAMKVQKLSGAVKVKVKNLVIDKLPKIPDFGLLYT